MPNCISSSLLVSTASLFLQLSLSHNVLQFDFLSVMRSNNIDCILTMILFVSLLSINIDLLKKKICIVFSSTQPHPCSSHRISQYSSTRVNLIIATPTNYLSLLKWQRYTANRVCPSRGMLCSLVLLYAQLHKSIFPLQLPTYRCFTSFHN